MDSRNLAVARIREWRARCQDEAEVVASLVVSEWGVVALAVRVRPERQREPSPPSSTSPRQLVQLLVVRTGEEDTAMYGSEASGAQSQHVLAELSADMFEDQEQDDMDDAPQGRAALQVAGLCAIVDREVFVVVFTQGYIVEVALNSGAVEQVGFMHEAVLSVSQSPDGDVLSLVTECATEHETQQRKVTLMTADWEPMAECRVDLSVELQTANGYWDARAWWNPQQSWRGDGNFVVITFTSSHAVVFSREGEIHATLNYADAADAPLAPRGQACSWQPRTGGVIALAALHDTAPIRFFERNGLRHHRNDFDLATASGLPNVHGRDVLCLQFSPDSELLAVCVTTKVESVAKSANDEPNEGTRSQILIYHRGNYHWYLKHVIRASGTEVENCTFSWMQWDDAVHMRLWLGSKNAALASVDLRWLPGCLGSVSDPVEHHLFMLDGTRALVSPLKKAMPPPPMCMLELNLRECTSQVVVPWPSCLQSAGVLIYLVDGTIARSRRGSEISYYDSVRSTAVTDTAQPPDSALSARPNMVVSNRALFCFAADADHSSVVIVEQALGTSAACTVGVFTLDDQSFRVQRQRTIDLGGAFVEFATRSAAEPHVLFVITLDQQAEGSSTRAKRNLTRVDFAQCSVTNLGDLPELSVDVPVNQFESFKARHEHNASVSEHLHLAVLLKSGALILLDVTATLAARDRLQSINGDAGVVRRVQAAQLSAECTSFAISDAFLVFTTRSHTISTLALHPFQHVSTLITDRPDASSEDLLTSPLVLKPHETCSSIADVFQKESQTFSLNCAARPIDRGSMLVSAFADDVRVVLIAPRGNFECICPRPIAVARLLHKVRVERDFSAAFSLCRAQRLDAELLVRAASYFGGEALAEKFIGQIGDDQKLSVFVSLYADAASTSSESKVANIVLNRIHHACEVLGSQFLYTSLTALTLQTPPQYAAALKRVLQMDSRKNIEAAVDYIIVLASSDAELVYTEALGTYDLRIAAMVAARSQLDPKEFGEQLKWLHQLPEHRRKFEIDCICKRYASALEHLVQDEATAQNRESCVAFAVRHHLYSQAMRLFAKSDSDTDKYSLYCVREAYAAYLLDHDGQPFAAGSMYLVNGQLHEAARAFRDGCDFEMALDVARRVPSLMDASPTHRDFVTSVADTLLEHGRIADCANVRVTHLKDGWGALELVLEHELWLDAVRIIAELGSDETFGKTARERLESCVHAAHDKWMDLLRSNLSKTQERHERLLHVRRMQADLRERLAREAELQTEGGNDASSDVFSDTTANSSIASNFTFASQSTAASLGGGSTIAMMSEGESSASDSAASKAAKVHLGRENGSSTSKKATYKAKKKRIKPGHPQEETYLAQYLQNFIPSAGMALSVGALINVCLYLGDIRRASAVYSLFTTFCEGICALPDDVVEGSRATRPSGEQSRTGTAPRGSSETRLSGILLTAYPNGVPKLCVPLLDAL
ncbi:Elongator complex protein 1 [Porphyridium purpureum]|uniref:Elongator complex protein 1 n=1 Tax=Porphyridium purpureum TaxID=35688 RepID=A0A5J4YZA6_PORPP|nr:Elongator complex protein 1 [Porphyridium purpureum]|eukprot:POR7671..scf208_2